jgi:hypothetical protein
MESLQFASSKADGPSADGDCGSAPLPPVILEILPANVTRFRYRLHSGRDRFNPSMIIGFE